MDGPPSGHHPAVEEYLETIWELEESGVPAMRARLVERLGVTAPAVSDTVRRLEREGYVTLDQERVMHLTESGRRYATTVVRRHRLAERLLVDVLKLPWHQVHEEAGRLEHAISDNLEKHLLQLLDDPSTCPHGNPIPGAQHPVDVSDQVPMAAVGPGSTGVVRRIDERLEAQLDRMRWLEENGVMPGRAFAVTASGGGTTSLTVDGASVQVPDEVAALVYAQRTA